MMKKYMYLQLKTKKIKSIKWLLDNEFSYDFKTFKGLIYYNCIKVTKWFINTIFPHDKKSYETLKKTKT